MTKVHPHVRTAWAITAAAVCLTLAGACARTTEQRGTGETHFLYRCTEACSAELRCIAAACTRTCEDDDVCADLGAGATCEALPEESDDTGVARACDVVCGRDQDCAALGADFACEDGRCRSEPGTNVGTSDAGADAGTSDAGADAGTTDAAAPSCPADCVVVNGYAEATGEGCVDRERLGFVGCDCNPAAAFPHCGRRTTDDTLWVFHSGELSAESNFTDCTLAERERVMHSCEFAACEVPPLSICTLEATCGDRGCDNPEFDAQGCRRPECTTDAECAGDQRCVLLDCVAGSWCTPANPGPDETCGCSGSAACFPGAACNPVATAGPRGAWQSLEFVETAFEACPERECTEIRTVDPSGAIVITPLGSTQTRTAMLSEDDRTALAQLIDGPSLRVGARDGFGCGETIDLTIELRLELPDDTYTQSVAGCIYSQPDEHELARLYEMLRAY